MARVLITGASRGIGREAVKELTARGHEVIATARDPSFLEDMPAAVRLQLDVTDESSVQAAIEAAGPIDVLVSNAGATMRAPMETVPLAEVEQLFNINTFGALRVAQAVLPGMRQSRFGKLIFVSSIQGRVAIPLIGPYAASKWALEAIAETLAIEVRHFGISVSVLQPGAVSSGGAERAKSFLDDSNPYRPLLDQLGGFLAPIPSASKRWHRRWQTRSMTLDLHSAYRSAVPRPASLPPGRLPRRTSRSSPRHWSGSHASRTAIADTKSVPCRRHSRQRSDRKLVIERMTATRNMTNYAHADFTPLEVRSQCNDRTRKRKVLQHRRKRETLSSSSTNHLTWLQPQEAEFAGVHLPLGRADG